MSTPPWLKLHVWHLSLLFALSYLVWHHGRMLGRAEYVSAQALWSVEAAKSNREAATGWSEGRRNWVVAERNPASLQVIIRTQAMLADGELRQRHVSYENAPFGRENREASLYSWYLGGLAKVDQFFSQESSGPCVERAAAYADPLLQVLVLVGFAFFVARWFGGLAATVFSPGFAFLYPWLGEFVAGAPDPRGLGLIFALGSILAFVAALGAAQPARARLLASSGLLAGLSLWNDVGLGVPLVLAQTLGLLLVLFLPTRAEGVDLFERRDWRIWALSGAGVVLAATLLEYFPGSADLKLEWVHPLYGLAWLGLAEILGLAGRRFGVGERKAWERSDWVRALLALLFLASVPAAMLVGGSEGFLVTSPLASRLSKLASGTVAPDLWAWILRDGFSPSALATLMPLLALPVLVFMAFSRAAGPLHRARLFLLLPALLVSLGFACVQLRLWSVFDLTLLAALGAVLGGRELNAGPLARCCAGLGSAALLLPGLIAAFPASAQGEKTELSRSEVQALVERDLSQWLAVRAGDRPVIVLAAPDLSSLLSYHGGLRGIASFDPENKDGLSGAVRLASANNEAEALALAQRRGLTHIILPSWNRLLDGCVAMAAGGDGSVPDDSLLERLHRWTLPLWLRPVPYHLPKIEGYEDQAVVVLEVVEEQDEPLALARQAEYFIEMEQLPMAISRRSRLKQFPADMGAAVALAQIEAATGDAKALNAALVALDGLFKAGADKELTWDRRVNLAVVLTLARRNEAARQQLKLCLAAVDEAKLRALGTGTLVRLLALSKLLGEKLEDRKLRELAPSLLPPSLRARL